VYSPVCKIIVQNFTALTVNILSAAADLSPNLEFKLDSNCPMQ